MKRYISFFACFFSALTLCSCLRDAYPTPTVPVEDTLQEESFAESVSMPPVTEADTVVTEYEEELPQEVISWCCRNPDADRVIMTPEEIAKENERILNASESMTDIFAFPDTVSAEVLKSMISRHALPGDNRYDSDGSEIQNDHIDIVRQRMTVNEDGTLRVKLGIMTSRGNVRMVPDNKPYRKSPDNPYDSVQSTELSLGTPVLVLYTTYDFEYYFVLSCNYSGWVHTGEVAIAESRDEWLVFAQPNNLVCITDPLYRDGDLRLDMGATLPFTFANGVEYTIILPARNPDGTLSSTEYALPHASACIGYLPYTYKNYLAQAYKYEGTPYGWGGLDDGIDCSGLVLNVFRTFGFSFPRDTSQQDKIIGDSLYVAQNAEALSADRLDTFVPTVVYYPGHTLLYIGRDDTDGKYYFIHAPQIGECVTVTSKTSLAGLTYVCRIERHE